MSWFASEFFADAGGSAREVDGRNVVVMRAQVRMASIGAAAILAAVHALPAQSQAYPERPIRLVVPYVAGSSSNDIIGRKLAQHLGEALGQQVIVENRAGGGGTIGTGLVAKAAPDGYTLVIGTNGPLAIAPGLYPKLDYGLSDFTPIAKIAVVPYILVANAALPVKGLKDLVALAKRRPGQLAFASSGSGGTPHLCVELLKQRAGVDLLHVPYKGGSPALIDTISGHTQVYCSGVTGVAQALGSGRLRAIAMTTARRSALLPEIPTVAELGYPDFDVAGWIAILGPAKMPQTIVRRLHDELDKLAKRADIRSYLLSQGAEPDLLGPSQLEQFLKEERARWSKVTAAGNIKLD